MNKTIATLAVTIPLAAGLAATSAHAGDKASAGAEAKGATHKGVMTKRLGEEIPTMTAGAEKAAEKSKAPESETYTKAVGKTVPEMTAPDSPPKGN